MVPAMVVSLVVAMPPAVLMSAVTTHHIVVAQVSAIDVQIDADAAHLHVALQRNREADARLPTATAQPEPHLCIRRVVDLGRRVIHVAMLGAPAVRGGPWRRIGVGRRCDQADGCEGEHKQYGDARGFHGGLLIPWASVIAVFPDAN